MKKLIAVILALVMVLAVFTACSSGGSNDSPAPSSAAPEASSEPPVSTEPVAPPASSSKPANTIHTGSGVGFYSDDADWFGRPAYKFAYVCYGWTFLNELFGSAFTDWGKRVNFEFTTYDAQMDMNNFFAACESYAGMGYEGIFIDPDPVVARRVIEYCDELGLCYMPVLNPLVDNDTRVYLGPAVNLDSYYMGEIQTQWFFDNYKNYWPDVNLEDIGFLYLFTASNENFRVSMEGSRDVYQKNAPELLSKCFLEGDMMGYDLNAQAGLEYCSTVITSHSEFKYWFITSCLEDIGQGGARAAEDLNIESNVIVLTNGVNWLIQDWDNGYEGCWVGGVHFGTAIWAEPMACGLIALVEGRATYETLWGTEFVEEGQSFPCYPTPTKIVLKDTYKAYLQELDDYLA